MRNYHVSGLGLNILLNRRHFFAIRPHGCIWTRNIEQMTKYASKSSRSTKDEINQRHSVSEGQGYETCRNLQAHTGRNQKRQVSTSTWVFLAIGYPIFVRLEITVFGGCPPFPPFSAAVWLPPEHRLDSMRCELLFAGLLPQFLTRQDGEGMRG